MPNANVILNNSHKQILFHTNSDWLDNLIRFESFMNYDKHCQAALYRVVIHGMDMHDMGEAEYSLSPDNHKYFYSLYLKKAKQPLKSCECFPNRTLSEIHFKLMKSRGSRTLIKRRVYE